MAVDLYSICPCGSGKKIKFCKCKDSVHEVEDVFRLIEGGQVVPALDRMSAVLDKDPEAAWVLAIRGRLLMDLREYDSLADNAERFIRLQPSNPLALTQRAAAKLFGGDLEAATEGVLEALTESGKDVDSFVLDVASVLAYSLSQAGVYLTSRVYATLGMVATGYEGGSTSLQVLRAINSSPRVNGFLKQVPEPHARPDGVDWAERYDEAATLLQSNKVLAAQSKFESLQRIAANQPAVLGGLLTCAIWLGDSIKQAELLEKLSRCESLTQEERIRYLATAITVDPKMPLVSVPALQMTAEIEKVDEVQMAMAAASRFVALPAEYLSRLQLEDEVPPRAAYQIADRDVPESETAIPPAASVPEVLATVVVFGKQTDRAARLEVLDVRADQADVVKNALQAISDNLVWKQEESPSYPLPLIAEPSLIALRIKANPMEVQAMQDELFRVRVPKNITNVGLPILKGKSLEQTKGDASLVLERSAVVRLIEQYDSITAREPSIMDDVYSIAGLDKPPMIRPTAEQIEVIENVDLIRIDPQGLDVESMVYLLRRAQQVSATPATLRLAEAVLATEIPAGDEEAKIVAYMAAIQTVRDPKRALALIDEAKAFAETHSIDHPPLYFTDMSLRLATGDPEGFQNAVGLISTRYRNQPEIMAQLQQMLINYGLIRPDGRPRTQPGAAVPSEASPSGLWTPDQGSPSAGSSSGGGKIILPGMD
jgi:tetratricopeptide (TPR) repeat protein